MKKITETIINEVHEDHCELADEIDENEFKGKFFPEKTCKNSRLIFVSVRNPETRKEENIENIDKDFPNVGMIKPIFPQLLDEENSQMGLALNCIHEMNLKPGIKPIKQKVRRVPVNFRDELKKSIDSMLERGIIRHSTSEWASPIVLVRNKTGKLRVA